MRPAYYSSVSELKAGRSKQLSGQFMCADTAHNIPNPGTTQIEIL